MTYTVGTYQFPTGFGLYNLWQSMINGALTWATQDGKTVILQNGQIIPDSDKVVWVINTYQTGVETLGTTNYNPSKPGQTAAILLADLFALYVAPPTGPIRAYPKLYLQDDIQITTETTNFGPSAVTINSLSLNGNPIIGLADGTIPQSAATVKQLTTAIDAVTATASSNLSTTTASINAVKGQVDTILAGASTSLDTLKEIADYYSSLDATQQLNLANQVTTLTGLVSSEQSRATAAEQVISTGLAAEVARATTAEVTNVRRTEFEIPVLPAAAVFADGDQPQKIPDSLKLSASFPGLDGWYYKNLSANAKINWYLPKVDFLTGASLRNVILNAFVVSTASPLFITVYTQKTGSNDLASWYHSRAVYCIQDTSLLTPNTLYHFYTTNTPSYVEPGYKIMQLPLDSFSSRGTVASTDKILMISIGSNSAAAVGTVESVVSKCKVVVNDSVTWTYTFSDMIPEVNAINATASALAATVGSVSNSVSAEATRAQSQEATLATGLNNEVAARTTAVTTVTTSLNTEISRAQAAEATLTTNATALTARVTSLEAQVEQLYQSFFQLSRSAQL